ncbi:MAG: hypothetical protein J6T54_04450 [Fibrobacter sp.]|nr:hypothetical protein [Fibrobacter sp.]
MKLKSQFLSLSALLAMGMATTAWGAEVNLATDANGIKYVNMPSPVSNATVTNTLNIPNDVQTFKVYDDGGVNGPFTSTSECSASENCSEYLQLNAPTGYFLHLTGSIASNGDSEGKNATAGYGAVAHLKVYNGSQPVYGNWRINPAGNADVMEAWTQSQMLLQFHTTENELGGTNGAGLDLTIEVALDIGQDGLGFYTFPSTVDHLEMHASPAAGRALEKTTVLTSPSGSFMYLTFNDTLATGDSVFVLNGDQNSTDTLLKTSDVNNDTVYSSSNKLTVCVKASEDGLDKIVRATAYVVAKNTNLSTAGIDFYTNETSGYTVAKISDIATGTVSIPSPVNVDDIIYDRKFKANTKETIVLPFSLPEGATTNAKFYYLQKVVQQDNICAWKATLKRVATPEANKPYAIIIENNETELRIDLKGGKATFQTAGTVEQLDQTENWIFKGTYEYKTWESDDEEIGLAYALAKENGDGFVAGQFVRIGDGTSAAPMRAYMRKVNADVRLRNLSRPLAKGEVSSIESLPEVIDVELVDEDDKPMAIGRMNTVTGAIKINRWIDLKGRSTNHKPTTKGVFFNKKGIAK